MSKSSWLAVLNDCLLVSRPHLPTKWDNHIFGLVKKSYVLFCHRRCPISPVHNSYGISCMILTPQSQVQIESFAHSLLNLEDSTHTITSLWHKLKDETMLDKIIFPFASDINLLSNQIYNQPLERDTLACWSPPWCQVLSSLKTHLIVTSESCRQFCTEMKKTQLMSHLPKM
jgi:hypothetical protein